MRYLAEFGKVCWGVLSFDAPRPVQLRIPISTQGQRLPLCIYSCCPLKLVGIAWPCLFHCKAYLKIENRLYQLAAAACAMQDTKPRVWNAGLGTKLESSCPSKRFKVLQPSVASLASARPLSSSWLWHVRASIRRKKHKQGT